MAEELFSSPLGLLWFCRALGEDSGLQVSAGLRVLRPPSRHGSNSERGREAWKGSAGGQTRLTGNHSLCQQEDVDAIC